MPRTLQTGVFQVSRQTRILCLIVSVVFCLVMILTGGERAGAAGGNLDTSFNPGGAGGGRHCVCGGCAAGRHDFHRRRIQQLQR